MRQVRATALVMPVIHRSLSIPARTRRHMARPHRQDRLDRMGVHMAGQTALRAHILHHRLLLAARTARRTQPRWASLSPLA
jgi:hypothetical protein